MQFDLLWNNIMSNQAPGLNELEKSMFITKAENELTLAWFNSVVLNNNVSEGFDASAIRQMNFSSLMRSQIILDNSLSGSSNYAYSPTDRRALIYAMPEDLFLVVSEQVFLYTLKSGTSYTGEELKKISENDEPSAVRQVIPVSFSEYTRLMSKPYKEPLKRQAWRIVAAKQSADDTDLYAEIILNGSDRASNTLKAYSIRYVMKPEPVILTNLKEEYGDDVSIEGVQTKQTCRLHETTHELILQRAVALAQAAWMINNASQQQQSSAQ